MGPSMTESTVQATLAKRQGLSGQDRNSASMPKGMGRLERAVRKRRSPFVLGAPFAVLYLVFFIGPLVYALVESSQSPLTGALSNINYSNALRSGQFWQSMLRMLLFTVVQVGVMLLLATVLALLLDSSYCRGRKLFAVVFFLPYAVPGVIAAIMWSFILSPVTDNVVRAAHINPLSTGSVFYVLVVIATWEWTGYNVVLYLAGLTSIPGSVIDAARIDGCGEVRLALLVKLGMLRNILVFTAFASMIGTFQLFNEPDIINYISPLPANYTPNLLIYNTAFRFGDVPLASAESMIMALVTIVAAVGFTAIARRRASL